MKKLLLTLLLLVVVLLAGVVGYLYMNADALLARLKPELERIASQAMNTPVKLGELRLGLGLKPTVTVDGVSLGDSADPKAISVKRALLALDLVPLLSKELKITELRVEQPRITAIKQNGAVKIVGLPEKPAGQESAAERAPRNPSSQAGASAEKLPVGFALEKFLLSGGEIVYEDTTQGAPLPRIAVQDISVSSELMIADNKLKLSNADVSTTINQALPLSVTIKQILYDLGSTDTTLESIVLKVLDSSMFINGMVNTAGMKGSLAVSSTGLDLSKLTPLHAFVPALSQFPLSGIVNPDITVNLAGASAWEAKGTVSLKDIGTTVNNLTVADLGGTVKLHATPAEQRASGDDLTFAFQGSPMKVSFAAAVKGTTASLEKLDLAAFSGAISAQADTVLGTPQTFKTTSTISSLNIDQALSALSGGKESALSGIIDNVALSLGGELGETLKQSAGGRITFRIRDAILKQVNLAHEAFKGILTLPLVGDKIMASVPDEFRAELTGADTKIRMISGSLNGTNGTFNTSDFTLLGSFFTIRGSGNLSMTGAVDLKTTISFNDRFSGLLAERVKELRPALDRNGELTFPLAISGTAPKLTVIPDTKALVKLGAEAAVREGATRLLEGALKSKTGDKGQSAKGLGKLLGF